MRSIRASLILVAALMLGGCGYNTLQTQDEATTAAWSEVVNQYQRRADLIPNLVNTVKGFAAQEEKVLVGVTEARARATKILEIMNHISLRNRPQLHYVVSKLELAAQFER